MKAAARITQCRRPECNVTGLGRLHPLKDIPHQRACFKNLGLTFDCFKENRRGLAIGPEQNGYAPGNSPGPVWIGPNWTIREARQLDPDGAVLGEFRFEAVGESGNAPWAAAGHRKKASRGYGAGGVRGCPVYRGQSRVTDLCLKSKGRRK